MNSFKKIATYVSLSTALGLSGFMAHAQMQGGEGMMNCPHMDKSEKMGCSMMMNDCPMMDENVSFTVNNTENGMVVEWTGQDQESIEKIQKMGEHMRKMKEKISGSESSQ